MIHAEIASHGTVQASAAFTGRRRPARVGAIVAAAICGVIATGGWIVQPDRGPAAMVWAVLVRFLAGRGPDR